MNLKDSNVFEKFELDRDNPIPLYYQIAQSIREAIQNEILKPGDKLLTEEKLQDKFNVSRATVRKAVSDLVYEGLLEKKPSKGTIVSVPKVEDRMVGVMSFTKTSLDSNKALKTEIIEFNDITNHPEISKKLQLDEKEVLRYMKRIRYIDGAPVAVEDWYAPGKYLPNFTTNLFTAKGVGQSSYHVLQNKYHIKLGSIYDTITAVALEKSDAKFLSTSKGMPALLRQRITYDEKNIPIAYASGLYLVRISLAYHSDSEKETSPLI